MYLSLAVVGAALGLGGWLLATELLFWSGVFLSACSLALIFVGGKERLTSLTVAGLGIGMLLICPWYAESAFGLIAWALVEAVSEFRLSVAARREALAEPKCSESLPAVSGGDGLDSKTAAIINCASLEMARFLVEQFISERHGEVDVDWSYGPQFCFEGESGERLRCMIVNLPTGECLTYFFDYQRPLEVLSHMLNS